MLHSSVFNQESSELMNYMASNYAPCMAPAGCLIHGDEDFVPCQEEVGNQYRYDAEPTPVM